MDRKKIAEHLVWCCTCGIIYATVVTILHFIVSPLETLAGLAGFCKACAEQPILGGIFFGFMLAMVLVCTVLEQGGE